MELERYPPLSLYVHIPWCVRKCPYCDFNSHRADPSVDPLAYVDRLLLDLEYELEACVSRPIASVFIGGGTPSLLEADALARLLDGIARRCSVETGVEITLEANPGTAEARRFRAYRRAGVNRLSLGVQSLDDAMLARLGRVHSSADAQRAYAMARDAGFDNVNLDLMYGLPEQTLAQAMDDLHGAIAWDAEHLSWYQLTLEPNTRFHHSPPVLPSEDLVGDMMDSGHDALAGAGYRRYEISAHARDQRMCRHNLNYWRFGDYLGIGAGAHGKLTSADGVVRRRGKLRQPAAYMAAVAGGAISVQRVIGERELPVEFMMNALRLIDGVPAELFTRRTGLPLSVVAAALDDARARGLLRPDVERLAATQLGLRFLDELLTPFEPDEGLV